MYISHDPESGFTTHATLEEAIFAANETVGMYKEERELSGYINTDIESVFVAKIIQSVNPHSSKLSGAE